MMLIGEGKTKTAACDEVGISTTTYDRICKENTELKPLAEEAEERGYDTMAERLVNIDKDQFLNISDPKWATVISNNIKWFLARRKKDKYGDTMIVDTRISVDKAIIEALTRGQIRASEFNGVIDANFTVSEPKSLNRPLKIEDLW
jgi:hypothetical protein